MRKGSMQYVVRNTQYAIQSLIPALWSRLPITPKMRNGLMWLLSPKYSVGVVGVVISDSGQGGEVLLLKHTYRGEARAWGLLGGGLKPGESLKDCLRREMQEETGLQIEVDRHLLTAAVPTRKVIEIVYACHLLPGQTLAQFRSSPEVVEARFFAPDALPHGVYEKHKQLIREAIERT